MAVEPSFGERHFGGAELGDRRRTARLVELADQLAAHPGGTLPEKTSSAAQLQALYRLLAREEVTHEAIFAAHRAETLRRAAEHDGPLLALCDTTELDYTSHARLERLGPIGDGGGRGYLAHHVLLVDPASRSVIGLAEQLLHVRRRVPPGEKRSESRAAADRESRLWTRGTAELPAEARLTVVADRGADLFEFLEHEARSGRRFLVRAKADRNVLDAADRPGRLYDYARRLPACAARRVVVGPEKRTAELAVSYGAVRLVPPRQPCGEHSQTPLAVGVVRVWEERPSRGATPIEWLLVTPVPCTSAADALRTVDDYACRWIIEEYHKCLKTGCGVERLQLGDEARLEPMIALLSVTALTLLQLRDACRDERRRDEPAARLVPRTWLRVLRLHQGQAADEPWSIAEFTRALARLGGHAGYPSTPRPGWITLWRGWEKLRLLALGAELVQIQCD
jgi:hypothetical protein